MERNSMRLAARLPTMATIDQRDIRFASLTSLCRSRSSYSIGLFRYVLAFDALVIALGYFAFRIYT